MKKFDVLNNTEECQQVVGIYCSSVGDDCKKCKVTSVCDFGNDGRPDELEFLQEWADQFARAVNFAEHDDCCEAEERRK